MLFLFFSSFIYRGLCALLTQYRRVFFTLVFYWLITSIGKQKVYTVRKIIRKHIFICNVTSSLQEAREQCSLSQEEMAPLFPQRPRAVLTSNLRHGRKFLLARNYSERIIEYWCAPDANVYPKQAGSAQFQTSNVGCRTQKAWIEWIQIETKPVDQIPHTTSVG